jgi:dipeptidyl-peptidase-4
VHNNNLFCKNLADNTVSKLTTDGQFSHIINGAPDWVYEEEFTLLQAFAWSPDSRKIAFMRFDESAVPEFCMTLFQDLYPRENCFKYPKAGERNATVEVRVINLQTGKTSVMDAGSETNQYNPRIQWTPSSDTVCLIRLNRLQNKVDVLFAHAGNGHSRIAFSETNARYISEIDDNYIHFTPDSRYFIIRSERSGFTHYYRYTLGGKLVNAITKGNWDTDAILGYDDAHGCLYFTSTEESPIRRNVYGVRYDGSHKTGIPGSPGTNSALFSSNFRYYINTWSDANTPTRITLHKIDGTLLRVLEDNSEVIRDIKLYGFTRKKFISIPVSENLSLNAYMVLPADFDSTRRYPLFIKVYGGPESQDVVDAWDTDLAWEEYLALHGIVVACIDNRGTDGRGEDFRKSIYMQLGKYETEDQIAAARWLGNKPWIDESRIGIWGWSYGGYMTLLCMTKGSEVFKMGISVAPVTNWRFYDTVFTERYMRTPAENAEGYDKNSPIHFTSRLKGKLLLVHGTGDDNVHFQNSTEIVSQLVRDNKQFEVFFYPNKNHNISGGNTRLHLFTMLSQFVADNL